MATCAICKGRVAAGVAVHSECWAELDRRYEDTITQICRDMCVGRHDCKSENALYVNYCQWCPAYKLGLREDA